MSEKRDYGAEQTELAAGEYEMVYTTDKLIDAVIKWGDQHNLHDPKAQMNKVTEEVGEIAHEVSRNNYGTDFRDAIGDTLVTIIILASIGGSDPRECLQLAYDTIKERKGITKDGTFIKYS